MGFRVRMRGKGWTLVVPEKGVAAGRRGFDRNPAV
jgi:hypothetical protein